MSEDIRLILQKAEEPSDELDILIADALGVERHQIAYSRDFTASIKLIEAEGCDWIMANVNGHMGGTPYACVGDVKDSYSGTPLLSLWLSYFRFKLGEDRDHIV